MASSVVAFKPLSEDEALNWLFSQPGGQVVISAAELGRRWNWHRQRVGRRLQAWSATGKISRKGKHICTVAAQKPSQAGGGHPPRLSQSPSQGGVTSKLLATLLFLIGLSIAVVLVTVNVTSWANFAKNALAWYAFVTLGATVSVSVMILPAAILISEPRVRWTLRALFVFLFLVDVLVSVGFAYGNFGSAVAGTEASVGRRAFLERRIHSLISERQRMPAFVPTAQRAVDDAKAAVARECVKVGPECRKREVDLTEANRALGLTERSEKIAGELREAEGELQSIPVTASADPLTDGVIDLVYQTSGHKLEPRAVTTGRNVIFALFLLVPAGFFRGAASLARR